jgi:GxxExxY protein
MQLTKIYLKELTYQVIGSAIVVHSALGPGLLESIYHKCLEQELKLRGIKYVSQLDIPIVFKGIELNAGLRPDLVIENCLITELKAIDDILPIHKAQLLTYMKLLEMPKGILINFNCSNIFKEGQKTLVNHFYTDLP